MKTKITFYFLLSIVCLTNLHSQNYDSMVVTTKIWSNVTGYYGADMNEYARKTAFIKFAVDPNTIEEKQVLVSNDSLKTWTKVGNITEVEKKIYFTNLENKQGLLYDFAVKQGDRIRTVNTSIYEDSITFQVVKVDTLNYLGIDRQRFEVIDTLTHCTDYWIEGIGSLEGLFRPQFSMVGGFTKLLCVQQNSTQIYQNPLKNSCYINDYETEVKEISKSKIYVYPNPTLGKISFEGISEIQEADLYVYNMLGTLIYKQHLTTKDIRLNLEKGIYILTLVAKNDTKFKQIITIQ